MAVTNAISAIIIVSAMLAAGLTDGPLAQVAGTLAVALAAVNVFGGFLVTQRMLEMFRKKEPKAKQRAKDESRRGLRHHESGGRLMYLISASPLAKSTGKAEGLSSPLDAPASSLRHDAVATLLPVYRMALILKLKEQQTGGMEPDPRHHRHRHGRRHRRLPGKNRGNDGVPWTWRPCDR